MKSRWFVVFLLLIYPAVARSQGMTFGQCQFQCGNNFMGCTSACAGKGSGQCNNSCTTVQQSCMMGCGQLPFIQPGPTPPPLIPIPGVTQPGQ
jgi:hypothetical protein